MKIASKNNVVVILIMLLLGSCNGQKQAVRTQAIIGTDSELTIIRRDFGATVESVYSFYVNEVGKNPGSDELILSIDGGNCLSFAFNGNQLLIDYGNTGYIADYKNHFYVRNRKGDVLDYEVILRRSQTTCDLVDIRK